MHIPTVEIYNSWFWAKNTIFISITNYSWKVLNKHTPLIDFLRKKKRKQNTPTHKIHNQVLIWNITKIYIWLLTVLVFISLQLSSKENTEEWKTHSRQTMDFTVMSTLGVPGTHPGRCYSSEQPVQSSASATSCLVKRMSPKRKLSWVTITLCWHRYSFLNYYFCNRWKKPRSAY